MTREAALADEIDGNTLYVDSPRHHYPLAESDRDAIVAALRVVGTAREELIREIELTKRNFSLD